jgi:hypothetical protein
LAEDVAEGKKKKEAPMALLVLDLGKLTMCSTEREEEETEGEMVCSRSWQSL